MRLTKLGVPDDVAAGIGAGIVVAAGVFTLWRQRMREKAAHRQA